MHYIDSHVHFYDTQREQGCLWPLPDCAIYSPHLPTQLQQEATQNSSQDKANPNQIKGVIAVETSKRFCDDQWLLNLSQKEAFICAVIANLDIKSDAFASNLDKALQYSKFRGIRLRPINSIDLSDKKLIDKLFLLPKNRSIVEAGTPKALQFKQFTDLAASCPQLTFVLDHFGHPEINNQGPTTQWLEQIEQFARLENTLCKITCLTQFVVSDNTGSEYYLPFLNALKNAFGCERLIYGSNWPSTKLHGGRKSTLDILSAFFTAESEREKVFFDNAVNNYGIVFNKD